ncbi:hypothetical protein [Halioxenophilus aromaticivorans]|uniref:Lipoprotein n=1 Tax=Halioxenophilus aromaticivorans TaxID=1306992 RepID=A0AAV3U5S0_9ALTE
MVNTNYTRLATSTLWLLTLLTVMFSSGCARTIVKSTQQTQLDVTQQAIPDNQLLDVGIVVFDPGIDYDKKQLVPVFPEIRKAESHYFAVQLMNSLQSSAAWGAVRVVPSANAAVDLIIEGKIVQSDGESLELHIKAADATGFTWLDKEYERVASRYSYDQKSGINHDPFMGIYNEIANDLLNIKRKHSGDDLAKIRVISELKFARDFSPEAFDSHVEVNKKGVYDVARLPAENDPMLARIRDIRERDYLFIDTLQDYYGTFVKEMENSYDDYRSQSYEEVLAVKELRKQARNRTLAGVAAVVGGVVAAGSSSGSARAAGQIGVIGGGYLIKQGLDKRTNSQMHVEALQELGDSLEADVEPHYFDLEDRTVTLTGSVQNQYSQWRKILRDIYQLETGGVASQ